MRMPRQ
jgi:hypothetical protein